jgi:rhodanese-related sulfurtransferase
MAGMIGALMGMVGKGDESCVTVYQAQEAGALIVDIRGAGEWKQSGVLTGARLITFESAERFVKALRPHLKPGQPVALICASGARTAQAKRMLSGQLDVPVLDIKGGMMGALRVGTPTTRPTRAAGCAVC